MTLGALRVAAGDAREYELAVDVAAILVGEDGPVAIERRYEALPRQNDTVDGDAVDTDDRLVADAASVHVHTKFYELADGDARSDDEGDANGASMDPAATVETGTFRRDLHDTWVPADPSVLTDGRSFEAACRDHLAETACAIYERGTEAVR